MGRESLPRTGEQSLPSARFWTKDELIAEPGTAYTPGSVFLGRVDEKMIGVRDNRHILTIAGSRSGKSACLLIPNLLLYPGSVMVIDPKGELAEATARQRRAALGQDVFVLDPFGVADTERTGTPPARHNPLMELAVAPFDHEGKGDRLLDDAALFAEALVTAPQKGDDHWSIAARNLVTALILLEICVGEAPSMGRLRHHLLRDEAGQNALYDDMAAFAETASEFENLNPTLAAACSVIARTGAFMKGRAEQERSGVIATAIEQLSFLESPAMARMFEGHDFSLRDLKSVAGRKPVTIYLVLPAEYVGTHARWLRLMMSLALGFFERNTAKPDHPVLLILEEFAALGYLRPIEQAAGYIAGSHVRLWSVLQDLPQLKRHYRDGWETFIGNAGIVQAFSVADPATCEFLSKRLGETTLKIENIQHVNSESARLGDTGMRTEYRTLPLMQPSEIALAFRRISENGEARGGLSLVLLPGSLPFVIDRVFHGDLEP